jgi:hypothetical protein
MIQFLLGHGARLDIRDEEHHGTPIGGHITATGRTLSTC